ncbi:YkgJ family cysteine cluster protein [Methanobacterium sp. ACI-7]|uniref:YkgJ family cysteine cluster protein n=1 Tax=unclassified Methanobacterium TaxID=2627676 RepID=UPI0039C09B72
MLRDLLIERELFQELREKALDGRDAKLKMETREKAVLKKLRKKRSVKKLKKTGITKGDLKEIVELSNIVSLELFGGPSDHQLAEEHPEWCVHCGTCCKESSPIFIHRDEVNPILMFNSKLEDEIVQNRDYPEHYMFKKDLPCKFHNSEENRCKIYNVRPQVCSTYPLVLIGEDKPRYIIDLRHKCDYSTRIVLEKAMILFDDAVRRLENNKEKKH